jgi:hypothetical protein
VDEWFKRIDNGEYETLVFELLTSYYDKLYLYSQNRRSEKPLAVPIVDLEWETIDGLVETLLSQYVQQLRRE